MLLGCLPVAFTLVGEISSVRSGCSLAGGVDGTTSLSPASLHCPGDVLLVIKRYQCLVNKVKNSKVLACYRLYMHVVSGINAPQRWHIYDIIPINT